jgi:hypothetical protein
MLRLPGRGGAGFNACHLTAHAAGHGVQPPYPPPHVKPQPPSAIDPRFGAVRDEVMAVLKDTLSKLGGVALHSSTIINIARTKRD